MEGKIYEVVTGSTAYNLDIEGSDLDRKGVYLPSVEEMLSMVKPKETIVRRNPDIEYHILEKFLKLALKQNPTILEMLFVEDEDILYVGELFEEVLESRELFLTKNVYRSFSGYAKDQLMRIKNSLGRVTVEESEDHAEYVIAGLLESLGETHPGVVVGNNEVKLNGVKVGRNGKYYVDTDILLKGVDFTETYAYLSGISNTVNNLNRRKSRNRRVGEGKLEKHAMHLVRLLNMGVEILRGEGVNVKRDKDREFLLDIRRGKVKWEELFLYVGELFKEMEAEEIRSELPEELDEEKVVKLHDGILERMLNKSE